ncbi:carboxymuconolactone decarboxylase family protein [Psychroflexus planctonicus]|nr:carboxymuconolactone decarboxylase family protein [Psychroflexus planctonicus]
MKLKKLDEKNSTGIAKDILENVKSKMGMIPNMFAYMANNPALLKSYLETEKNFREHAGFSSVEQEVILLSVSIENECTYCVAAHSFIAKNQSNVPEEVVKSLREGKEIKDKKLAALQVLTKEIVKTKAYPSQESLDEFKNQGYLDEQYLGVLTGIALKSMSNYFNHMNETIVDDAFSDFKWEKN